ncbi:hypothetical protein WA158_003726 [Blastocystis sp. Blastoise]
MSLIFAAKTALHLSESSIVRSTTCLKNNQGFRQLSWWSRKPKNDKKPEDKIKEDSKDQKDKKPKEIITQNSKMTIDKEKRAIEIDLKNGLIDKKDVLNALNTYFADSPKTKEKIDKELEETQDFLNALSSEKKGIVPVSSNLLKSVENENKPNNDEKVSKKVIPMITDSRIMPIVSITKSPLIVDIATSFNITDPRVKQQILNLQKENIDTIGVFLNKTCDDSSYNDCTLDIINNTKEVYPLGFIAKIIDIKPENDSLFLNIIGQQQVRLDYMVHYEPNTAGLVNPVYLGINDMDSVLINTVKSQIKSFVDKRSQFNMQLNAFFSEFEKEFDINKPENLVTLSMLATQGYGNKKQKILEQRMLSDQLDQCITMLQEHGYLADFRRKMDGDIGKSFSDTQKRTILEQEMAYIKKELGVDKDEKGMVIIQYTKRMEELQKRYVNPLVITKIQEEINHLKYMDERNAEYSSVRTYLDWIISIPWGIYSKDQLDLKLARDILNEDHYGLKDVKDRILEFISVGKLQNKVSGKVLCFVGPPGVGKTSIAKSIARALDREYYQFSVGGLSDISQIKGHRKTYVGSMPGKIVEALKSVKKGNPLILIDEIDKLKSGYNGDPASALLEALDPAQNNQFMDHYLDVPVDLSKTLFICTANDIQTIPDALRDRMEVIEIHGYDQVEKLNIAENYLDKKARIATGLTTDNKYCPSSLKITDDAFQTLIRNYCREAGVRNLEKQIEKIYRRIALNIAENGESVLSKDWTIDSSQLEKYIGKKVFISERMYSTTPPGVVMGLAWTSMGGSTLYLECNTIYKHPLDVYSKKWENLDLAIPTGIKSSKFNITKDEDKKDNNVEKDMKHKYTGHLSVTGQLGSVMQESTQLAYVNARQWMQILKHSDRLYNTMIDTYKHTYNQLYHKLPSSIPSRDDIFDILEKNDIYLHFPEGATPKDGPSAGCTITCAFLSKALNRPMKQDLAMTGEISLNGKVLPVGGIKEKVMAAKRAGVHTIIVPRENDKDINELPDYNKEGITFYYADMFEDVLKYSGLCDELFEEN